MEPGMTAVDENSLSDKLSSHFASEDLQAALAANAHAAIRWFGPAGPGESLSTLLDAMAVSSRATNGGLATRHPTEFLALLARPLCQWLPISFDESLVQN